MPRLTGPLASRPTTVLDDARITRLSRTLLGRAKDKAAKPPGLPFALTAGHIEWLFWRQNGCCALSGLPFNMERPVRSATWAPSLDRIVPSRGYVPRNVRLVCWIFNRAMADDGEKPLLIAAEALVRHQARRPTSRGDVARDNPPS